MEGHCQAGQVGEALQAPHRCQLVPLLGPHCQPLERLQPWASRPQGPRVEGMGWQGRAPRRAWQLQVLTAGIAKLESNQTGTIRLNLDPPIIALD